MKTIDRKMPIVIEEFTDSMAGMDKYEYNATNPLRVECEYIACNSLNTLKKEIKYRQWQRAWIQGRNDVFHTTYVPKYKDIAMTKEDTGNTVGQLRTAIEDYNPSEYGMLMDQCENHDLVMHAARELLTLKEQIAAGKVRIVPVEPTESMMNAVCSAIPDEDEEFISFEQSHKAMLSAAGAWNWEKGGFDESQ